MFINSKSTNPNLEVVENRFNLNSILRRFLDNWFWFVLCLIICVVLTKIYLIGTPTQYKVNATMMIEDNNSSSSSRGGNGANALGDFGSLLNIKSSVDNEQLVLETSDLMENVVRDLNLFIIYERKYFLGYREIYNECPIRLIPLKLASNYIGTFELTNSDGSDNYVLKQLIGNKVVKSYNLKIGDSVSTALGNYKLAINPNYTFSNSNDNAKSVYPLKININDIETSVLINKYALSVAIANKQSDALSMELTTSIPQKGVDILNQLIKDYSSHTLMHKNAFADSTISFINQRLGFVENDLGEVERRKQNFMQNNELSNIEAQSAMDVTNSSEVYMELNKTEVQLQVVNDMLSRVEDEKNNKRPVPSLITSPDPTFMAVLDKYNTLLINRDQLMLGSTENNPAIIHLDSQIASARKDLINSLKSLKSVLNITKSRLEMQNAKVVSQIQSAPGKQRMLLDLSRQQEIIQSLYQYLLQKKEEMEITKASNLLGARVIDRPKSTMFPFAPNHKTFYTIALLLGLGIPYAFFILRDLMNKKITAIKEITSRNIATVVGQISHSDSPNLITFSDDTRSNLAEQFRTMRTNVQFTLGRKANPVILFTSSLSGEGKSYISLNLAQSFVSLGKKVVMVDLDLRRPKLASNLNMVGDKIGFSNFMVSQLAVNDIITHTENPLFDVILSGPIPPNPSELLQDDKTIEMINTLKEMYDLVIIDTAPIGLVSDAQILSSLSDSILYVVRMNYSLKDNLNHINELLGEGKLKNLYLVINDIPKMARYGYEYDYNYGYYNGGHNSKRQFWKRFKQK